MTKPHKRAGAIKMRTGRQGKANQALSVPRRNVPATAPKNGSNAKDKSTPKPLGQWMAMRDILKRLGDPTALMLDVGAHYGNVTNMLLKLHPKPYVVCFEPNRPDVLKLLDRFPGASAPVCIVSLALGSKAGERDFYICGQGTEMSSLLPRSGWQGRRYYRHEVRETIKVQVVTLDGWLSDRCPSIPNNERVSILKMDVQGGERDVLLGAKDTLKAGAIDLIYSEVMFAPMYKGAWEFWEMCRYLSKYNYTLFDIYGLERSWVCRQLKYADALWVSPRVREKVINQFPEEWLPKSLPYRMCPER